MAAAGIKRSGVAVILFFTAAACAAEKAGAPPVAETPTGETPAAAGPAGAAQADLVVGDLYEVNVTCGGVTQSFSGKLIKASDRWIMLRQETVCGTSRFLLFRNVPIIGRWVRRACETPCDFNQWIPREAVTVVSHGAGPKLGLAEEARSSGPEYGGSCTCLARNGQVVEGEASLPATDDDELAVSISDASGSRQELVARRNIFCISQYERPGVDFTVSVR